MSDKPKKPRSSWTFYCMEMRPKLQKKNPDLNFREVSKKVNEDWKELSEKAKKKWKKQADEDKKRYEKELKKWQDEQTSESSEEELTRTRYNGRKKPIPKPVGARNCYHYFMMEKKKELKKSNPDMDSKKVNKKVSKAWDNISQKNKKKYIKMAEDDKKRYKKEMKKYEKDRPKTTSESEPSSD
ncbi:high mobility group protein dsp1 [Anaeramoeba flamelloides]|uniref:High mobility group protein dsp1 n=1 Tax=Anaeramoeba flamelloides TaxID=1746091 RepID=A0AAV8A712_9EUKA|nr:high mobility group protein dsp1 [Anaeramoeba flamelloides]|eukprot:Anaeramoba_flamelloidesc42487_g2_i1.p1 GENE.c42487_g2_i1~~c42487_g2_i1.p1  ORF type:complete len:184 (-),score=64.15 c42487_g2_i1:120-671(-)